VIFLGIGWGRGVRSGVLTVGRCDVDVEAESAGCKLGWRGSSQILVQVGVQGFDRHPCMTKTMTIIIRRMNSP